MIGGVVVIAELAGVIRRDLRMTTRYGTGSG